MPSPLRAYLPLLTCIAICAIPLAGFNLSRTNTLDNNGQWTAFKNAVEMEPMGVGAFMGWTQALQGGQLHLNAWHGFQEVLTKDKHFPGEITCDFRLDPQGYLVILIGRDLQNFAGFRLSAHDELPNAALMGPATGKFALNDALDRAPITPDTWHHAKVRVEDGSATLYLDGAIAGTMPFSFPRPRQIGFRGGEAGVMVDNVTIRDAEGDLVCRDDFMNWERLPFTLARALLFVLLMVIAVRILLRWAGMGETQTRGLIVATLLCATAALFVLWGFHFRVLSGTYPTQEAIERDAQGNLAYKRKIRTVALLRQAAQAKAHPEVRKIMFVGSSQTHGDGATRRDQIFVNVLRQRLARTVGSDEQFEIYNLAVPAETSTGLFESYEGPLAGIKPELVLINLSCNDRSNLAFEENLRRVAEHNRDRGIKTILVREAMSTEIRSDPAERTHTIVSRVGQEFDLPVVAAHEYLAERLDTGFLWWDVVHPTSYGHALIAEAIWPEIRDALEISEERVRPTRE